ncbi:hypothetical protein LIER_13932 [Lithospermum erythrorhizon]|uniref:Uncharacterized protein n=1 Tax=Lithospermum erythrorhizon TaxID=34254 RepID=A0AAV3PY68_LITER
METKLWNRDATVLARDIDKIRAVDDISWCQRSKVILRVKGDRNTAYFHAVSAQRSKINLITTLQDEEGLWHRTTENICKVSIDFYTKLFRSQSGGNMFLPGQLHTSQFEPRIAQLLGTEFVKEDVKKCLFTLAGSKSPRPDGMLIMAIPEGNALRIGPQQQMGTPNHAVCGIGHLLSIDQWRASEVHQTRQRIEARGSLISIFVYSMHRRAHILTKGICFKS